MELALPEQLEETPEKLERKKDRGGGEVKQGSGGKTNHGKTVRNVDYISKQRCQCSQTHKKQDFSLSETI